MSIKTNVRAIIVQIYNKKYPEEGKAIAKGLTDAAAELEIQPFMVYPYKVKVALGDTPHEEKVELMEVVRTHVNHTQAFIHALGFAKVEIDCNPESISNTGDDKYLSYYSVEIRIRISDFIL